MAKRLTNNQLRVLDVVVTLTREHGCPPILSQVAEAVGNPSNTRRTLESLQRKGLVRQPTAAGPWIPLMTPDGTSLSLILIDGDIAPHLHHFESLTLEELEEMGKLASGSPAEFLRDWLGERRAHG